MISCIPLFSGCHADVGYELKTDENGEKYYVASAQGSTYSLEGELVIPEYYGEGENRYPVKEIAEKGFSGTSITSLVIPKTVTKIGTAAFMMNNYLKDVRFAEGSGLTEIPWGIFGGCEGLSSVSLPDCVEVIDGFSFYGCANLTRINLPSSLKSINVEAFFGCSSLEHVDFPASLEKIGNLAFSDCASLKEVVFPQNCNMRDREDVPVLGENGEQKKDENGNPMYAAEYALGIGAFYSCSSLAKVVLCEGITSVTEGAFGGCLSLKEVYFPAGLKQIKGYYADADPIILHAFAGDSAIEAVYFAGTPAQWEEVKKHTDNVGYSGYDNGYILSAPVTCNYSYTY